MVDSGCISPPKDSSKVNTQTELLLLAAESILSSFSVQEQCDVGVRATVRLLLPHAPPTVDKTHADNNIIYEPRVSALIAEAISHRLPASDAEARDLLQLCEDVIRLGGSVIADACESLAYSRSLHHRSKGNLNRETYWLLRGMEVQSCWLPSDRQRKLGFASRRHFDSLCERSANNLICIISQAAISNFSKSDVCMENQKKLSVLLRAAEDVLEGVLQDDVMASVLKGHVEANLLKYAVDIALADAKGDTVQVATDIVHCLGERRLSEEYGGVVSTLANPKVYLEFLNIAFAMLAKEEDASEGKSMEDVKCSFTLHGMHILMARLTQVSSEAPADREKFFAAMRQSFCKGLVRAFVANRPIMQTKTSNEKEGSLDEEIELMLGPI